MATIAASTNSALVSHGLVQSKRPSSPDESSPGGAIMFNIFAFLMAAGLLFHELISEEYRGLFDHHSIMWLAGLWCLLKPSSMVRFFVMMAAMGLGLLLDLPWVLNHSIIVIVLAGAVLATGSLMLILSRSRKIDKGEFYQTLAPAVRVVTVLVYFFATLAKLNWGFLNPELSAGPSIYRDAARVIFLPTGEWTFVPAICGTLLMEGGLAALLFMRRTRCVGLLLAIPFHVMMALGGHIPFSGLAFAFLFPFVPFEFPVRLRKLAEKHPNLGAIGARIGSWAGSWWAFLIVAGVWLTYAVAKENLWMPRENFLTCSQMVGLIFFPYALVIFVLLILCLRKSDFTGGASGPRLQKTNRRLSITLATGISLLVIVNGLCPYAGLKTQTSFTMYSNLQTEGNQWNHLFMPMAMRVFSLQDHPVRIIDSNDPKLKQAAEKQVRWVFFEFQRYTSEHPEISISYEHNGKTEFADRAGNHPVLSRRPNFLARRLLFFRPVPLPEYNSIQH